MYRINIFDRFASAHYLEGYQGTCETLHGHNWKVEVEVQGNELDNVGMLIDFRELRGLLGSITKDLDHCLLNDLEPFKIVNPSSENIAKYLYDELKVKLPSNVSVYRVSVWESENSMATYFE